MPTPTHPTRTSPPIIFPPPPTSTSTSSSAWCWACIYNPPPTSTPSPNLYLTSPPGVGKTELAKALAAQLFNAEDAMVGAGGVGVGWGVGVRGWGLASVGGEQWVQLRARETDSWVLLRATMFVVRLCVGVLGGMALRRQDGGRGPGGPCGCGCGCGCAGAYQYTPITHTHMHTHATSPPPPAATTCPHQLVLVKYSWNHHPHPRLATPTLPAAAQVRLDMSEYMEKHAVSKLIGAPPGEHWAA